MPAYMVDLDVQCTEGGCTKRATVMVRNARGEEVRRCCAKHGKQLVDALNEA